MLRKQRRSGQKRYSITLWSDEKFRKVPYNHFEKFVSEKADRFTLLRSVLDECSLGYSILKIDRKHHIAVPVAHNHDAASGYAESSIILTAHYDRAPRSPGANDNGAAVFQLIETALVFKKQKTGKSALFIFTDGEELAKGESLRLQGSYSLGLHLRENGLGNIPVFSFDACGTGDTIIISTASEELLKNETGEGAEAARRKAQTLRSLALEAARKVRLEKVLLLPTPFSEDAGFLLSGMTAQTITALPQAEAALARGDYSAMFLNTDRRLIPETWRILNSPGDSPLRLTPEHWKNIVAFAEALAISG